MTATGVAIYYDMPASVYHAAPGLSSSGMKSLIVSPLHYWSDYIRADREPRDETPAMKLGTAFHAAVLESDTYLNHYSTHVSKDDFEECLDTVADLKGWLQGHHFTVKASMNKPDLIAAVQRIDPSVKILEVEMRRNAAANHDKILLSKDDMDRVDKMAKVIGMVEALKPILATGRSEVSIFVTDPETGARLKCRIDWMHQSGQCVRCKGYGVEERDGEKYRCSWCSGRGKSIATILDLKTFSAQDASIDGAVIRALRYRGYIRQAWFYTYILKLAGLGDFTWVNAFIESDAPYEVRLRSMGPALTRTALYWSRTGEEVKKLIKIYAGCQRQFAAEPWAYAQEITPVRDSEIPGLAYSSTEEEGTDYV